MYRHMANNVYALDGTKETIDSVLRGKDKTVWAKSLSNEWGRLAQGNMHGVTPTDTIDFIMKHEVPRGKKVTYATFVLAFRPHKLEKYRVRITVGGDRLEYAGDAGSPATNMLETKILVNSTISDAERGARMLCADIKDFFLATPMHECEYMKVHVRHIPDDIVKRYNLTEKKTADNHIYIRIKKEYMA